MVFLQVLGALFVFFVFLLACFVWPAAMSPWIAGATLVGGFGAVTYFSVQGASWLAMRGRTPL